MRKSIYLPHINYTVKVRPLKTHPDGKPAVAWMEETDPRSCTLYLPASPAPATIAHELVHVLQHICLVRNMEFLKESEHTAYVMQYLMMKILGHEWDQRPVR